MEISTNLIVKGTHDNLKKQNIKSGDPRIKPLFIRIRKDTIFHRARYSSKSAQISYTENIRANSDSEKLKEWKHLPLKCTNHLVSPFYMLTLFSLYLWCIRWMNRYLQLVFFYRCKYLVLNIKGYSIRQWLGRELFSWKMRKRSRFFQVHECINSASNGTTPTMGYFCKANINVNFTNC